MIAYLKGKVISRGENYLVLETGGVGYKIFTTPKLLATPLNTEIEVHTYMNVREDAQQLFGFDSPADLAFYEMLLSVSGVGPKGALSILSAENTELIKNAIASQDVAIFTKIGGVGKKTAEKIIVELKNKIGADGVVHSGDGSSEDLLLALESLGYSNREIKEVLGKLDPSQTLQEKMRHALKLLSK